MIDQANRIKANGEKMDNIELDLQHEIEHILKIQKNEIDEFNNLGGSNYVYSFIVKNQKYVIHKLNDTSIINWKQEKAAYNSLKPLNITDELVYYNNGIKITKFLNNSKTLSFSESDMIDALDLIRKVHESGASIKYDYNIIENMEKYISLCNNKRSKRLNELKNYRNKINAIQEIVNRLNIQPVLCHGDACVKSNFLRLPDESIKIIDWEQAGMADPLLDIAISALHQGFNNIDPVWCLHQYFKRVPDKQEYLRLFSFLALDSFALMAWCIFENPGDYCYYLKSAVKYSELVLNYYNDMASG
jgi:thiamine kinase-like enzyme